MPISLAVNDTIEIKLYSFCRDQLGINVLHYRVTGGTNLTTVDGVQAADFAFDQFATVLTNLMSDSADFVGTSFQKVRPAPATLAFFSTAASVPGAIVGDVLPLQSTGLITKRTDSIGRANRGRVYIPFPPESLNDAAGLPTLGYVNGLDTLAEKIMGPINVGTITDPFSITLAGVVYHRSAGGSTLITTTVSRRKWATQRRRGSYGKPNVNPFA